MSALRVAGAALALLVAAACAGDPLDGGPFPCASDGTCPESLTCAPGSDVGSLGMCMEGCSTSLDCEAGSHCDAAGGVGACLPDCTLFGTDCEPGVTCRLTPATVDSGYATTCVASTTRSDPLAPCELASDCAPQQTCYRAGESEPLACHAQCDAEHPCRRGATCHALIASGGGVCR